MGSSFKAIDKGRTALSGFYQIGEVALANKLEALYLASKEKKLAYWNFHDDVFKNFDWTTKPLKTIEQVYKERAQQLRDKYDYISISFSGGADSWNVLNSFLSNNIHVDEIYTRFPLAGTRKHMAANNTDFSARNLTSEYEYAVKPILEYVEKHFPKTKIIVDDITESYYEEVTEDEIIRTGHFALNGLSAKRCANNIGSDIDFDNKKVASIRGSGKFQLRKNENTFFIYFSDIEAWPVDSDPNFNLEYFYWSPEATELLALQAHLLKEYFILHQDLMWVIEANPITNPTIMAHYHNIKSIYNSIYKQVCYPQWNPNTFQTDKASGIQFEREDDFWIMSENAKSVQSWKWTVDQFYKSLHERAFDMVYNNPNYKRLKIFISPKYIINKY
jgi:hypothetical protein